MKNPLVTIALSVYNVEKYIDATLACIENQSYKNIEILCIDDCSQDKTYDILVDHSKIDNRYRIIRQDRNGGLSVSRNRAISEANGKYIIMLDGDDLFDESMVERAVAVAERNSSEMVIWDYVPFYNIAEISSLKKRESILSTIDINDKIALLRRPAFMWVRMLRIDKLKELHISFEPGLTKQDIPVHWKLVTSIENISILPEKLSYYRIQPESTSFRKDKSLFSLAIVMDIVGRYLKESGLYMTFREEYLRSRLSLLHGMYDFIKPDLRNDALDMVIHRLDQDAMLYLNNKNELAFRTRLFYGMIKGNITDSVTYKVLKGVRRIYRNLCSGIIKK